MAAARERNIMNKILIVDDSFPDRELVKEVLLGAAAAYDVRTAESGQAALMQIEQERPDLVLLDLHMNEMDGFETLKQTKAKWKETVPVLLISSFTDEKDRLHGLELGATDFISKPIIREEVLARVAVQMKIKRIQDRSQWVAEKTNQGIKLLYKELEKKNIKLKELDILKSEFISTVSGKGLSRKFTK